MVMSTALPERLKLETRLLHGAAERSGAMAALLAGRLPRAGYVAMLRNLQALYTALEAALQAARRGYKVTLAEATATLGGRVTRERALPARRVSLARRACTTTSAASCGVLGLIRVCAATGAAHAAACSIPTT